MAYTRKPIKSPFHGNSWELETLISIPSHFLLPFCGLVDIGQQLVLFILSLLADTTSIKFPFSADIVPSNLTILVTDPAIFEAFSSAGDPSSQVVYHKEKIITTTVLSPAIGIFNPKVGYHHQRALMCGSQASIEVDTSAFNFTQFNAPWSITKATIKSELKENFTQHLSSVTNPLSHYSLFNTFGQRTSGFHPLSFDNPHNMSDYAKLISGQYSHGDRLVRYGQTQLEACPCGVPCQTTHHLIFDCLLTIPHHHLLSFNESLKNPLESIWSSKDHAFSFLKLFRALVADILPCNFL
ncbi:hypothetical protein BOTBODRAFT_180729 [Botryobasidium botryosum FD-172 SS1]|uniref:Uncharacterized protein n=1 Tax=Botryobasidium botryosum (strain FD-172 SS1) TaxID=930990 RepID=A0A067LYK6_BOTB1|nr:hypothetical protein BOTBODRAFT_180729 [Botryobasidium botryosum FD-172 SS1]